MSSLQQTRDCSSQAIAPVTDDDVRLDSASASPGDQTLLRRFQAGDQDAATELYLRYAVRLQRLTEKQTGADLAARIDSEQVVQSVFRTFFRRASVGQYEVASGDDLWRLFLVIALNKIRATAKHHRAAKRDVARTEPLLPGVTKVPDKLVDDEVSLAVLKMTIDEILDSLPSEDRQIVLLRIDGYEVTEISQMTKRSKRTVERKLQEFRNRLQQIIE